MRFWQLHKSKTLLVVLLQGFVHVSIVWCDLVGTKRKSILREFYNANQDLCWEVRYFVEIKQAVFGHKNIGLIASHGLH